MGSNYATSMRKVLNNKKQTVLVNKYLLDSTAYNIEIPLNFSYRANFVETQFFLWGRQKSNS